MSQNVRHSAQEPVQKTADGATPDARPPSQPPPPGDRPDKQSVPGPRSRWANKMRRANYPAGIAATIWLLIVAIPLYSLLASTVQDRASYLQNGPLSLPSNPTLDSYKTVLEGEFFTYLINTVIVTLACSAIAITAAVTVAYTIVRTRSRISQRFFSLFLLGLAIPSQAIIIPVYWIITEMQLYDTLLAIILPTAAFSMPVSVLILVGSMRDIGEELYESMALDGASPTRILLQLVVPMSRGGISTVGVFSALQAWNGFLFPLILTTSQETRVLTLGLYDYVGEYRTDIPSLLAAVVLSIVPIFIAYLFARRQLINGLMGVGGK